MKIRHNATLVGAALLALTLMPINSRGTRLFRGPIQRKFASQGIRQLFRPRYTCRLPSPTVNARSYKQQHLLR